MTEKFEFKMMPYTTIELPMKRPLSSDEESVSEIASLTLNEVYLSGAIAVGTDGYAQEEKGSFEKLEITISITEDDPRLKALDLYTQYSGISSLAIKHGPRGYNAPIIAAYYSTPDWDEMQDRTLEVGEARPTIFIEPVNYAAASLLRARANPLEGKDGDTIEVGMCKGSNVGFKTSDSYSGGKSGGRIVVTVGNHRVFTPSGGDGSNNFAIECHNPLCEITFTFTDMHPIPLAVYTLWGYFDDVEIDSPTHLASAVYQPDWLKVGKIISRSGGGPYTYEVKTIDSISGNANSFSTVTVRGCFLKYSIGTWVLLAKTEHDPGWQYGDWKIVPSSQHYWKDAVDFFRLFIGD